MYNSRWKITKNQGFSILVVLLPLAAEESRVIIPHAPAEGQPPSGYFYITHFLKN